MQCKRLQGDALCFRDLAVGDKCQPAASCWNPQTEKPCKRTQWCQASRANQQLGASQRCNAAWTGHRVLEVHTRVSHVHGLAAPWLQPHLVLKIGPNLHHAEL